MMRTMMRASALACLLATSAFAQQPNSSVETHYARYRAAIERGDVQDAEGAATAALDASRQRDGDGGHTATLAYNLALVRIDDGRPGEAIEPATLALRIAEAGSASGLDPLLARLAFGQAQLAISPEQGASSLANALSDAAQRTDLDDRAFRAAAALGTWALEREQYEVARVAWAQAVAHVRGQAPADILARERARTAQAVAMIAEHAANERAAARDQAYALLTDSMDALYPFAIEQAANGEITPFQAAYAEAAGWRAYGRATYTPRELVRQTDLQGRAVCETYWSGGSGVGALIQGAFEGRTGVGVFRITTDDAGRIVSIDTAFATPPQDFSTSITPHLARLRARRASGAEPGCLMPQVIFQTIVFVGVLR